MHMLKNPCVIFIGSSGAGKSTVMQKCLDEPWPNGWKAEQFNKLTTRKQRDPLDELEGEYKTIEEIQEMQATGLLGVLCEKFGNFYVITRESMRHDYRTVYMQCLSASVVRKLKGTDEYSVHACLLEVRPETARARILSRKREITASELEERVSNGQGAHLRAAADIVIPADGEMEAVFSEVRTWLLSLLAKHE